MLSRKKFLAFLIPAFGVLTVFVLSIASFAEGVSVATYEWTKTATTVSGGSYTYGVTVDPSGNVYACGNFYDETNFGDGGDTATRTTVSEDSFISKYSSNGYRFWTKHFASSAGYSSTLDVDSNSTGIIVVGLISGEVDFNYGGEPLLKTSAGSRDGYIAKLDFNGDIVWVTTFGGVNSEEVKGVAINSDGSFFVTGSYGDNSDFGEGDDDAVRSSAGGADGFVSKYSSDGTRIWTKTFGGASSEEIRMIDVDASGNAYVTGYYYSDTDFGAGGDEAVRPGSSGGQPGAYVTKYESNGYRAWTKTTTGTSVVYGRGLSVDTNGNIFATGSFYLTADFGTGGDSASRTSNGSYDIYLTKYSSNGTRLWTKTFGGEGQDIPYAVDAASDVFITGYFARTVDFNPEGGDSITETSLWEDSTFTSAFNNSGEYLWTRTFDEGKGSDGYAIAYRSGRVYVGGDFYGAVDFNAQGEADIMTGSNNGQQFLTAYSVPVPTNTPTPTFTPTLTPTPTRRPTYPYNPTSTPTLTPTVEVSITPTEVLISATPLPATGDKIEVIILGVDGKPLINTDIKIDGKTYKTNSSGKIEVSGLSAGSHSVTYTVDGKVYQSALILGASNSQTPLTVSFVPTSDGTTTIYVLVFGLIAVSIGVYFVVKKRKSQS